MTEQLYLRIPPDPDKLEKRVKALRASQPVGDLYVAVFPYKLLCDVAFFDVRRMIKSNRDIEEYLGIQRPVNARRAQELGQYVNFDDASFPTAIIVAISDEYAEYDEDNGELILRNFKPDGAKPETNFRNLAKVIDGQHRIAGLLNFHGESFDVPVVVFVGSSTADQAYIFATVNLKQTKVNKSLAYDLYELESLKSPEKVAHDMAVAFDHDEQSPFFKRIKRLGSATPGRTGETLTQATFVESVLSLITDNPKYDRDQLRKNKKLVAYKGEKLPLRQLFIDKKFSSVAINIDNFFRAVRDKWPTSWESVERGNMLNKTNGFRALIRYFRDVYNNAAPHSDVLSKQYFDEVLAPLDLEDGSFVVPEYEPGTSGESKLYNQLKELSGYS